MYVLPHDVQVRSPTAQNPKSRVRVTAGWKRPCVDFGHSVNVIDLHASEVCGEGHLISVVRP